MKWLRTCSRLKFKRRRSESAESLVLAASVHGRQRSDAILKTRTGTGNAPRSLFIFAVNILSQLGQVFSHVTLSDIAVPSNCLRVQGQRRTFGVRCSSESPGVIDTWTDSFWPAVPLTDDSHIGSAHPRSVLSTRRVAADCCSERIETLHPFCRLHR